MSFLSSVKTSSLDFGFVNLRNLNFLHGTLQATSRKQSDLNQELQLQHIRVIDSAHMKTQLAHQLLREERKWKQSLEDAEKKKKLVSSTYALEYLGLNLKIHQARLDVKSLSLGSTSMDSDHSAAFHVRVQSLEDQKARLGEMKSLLMEATEEVESLKIKPSSVSELVKQFQQARDAHQLASSNYHSIKTQHSNINKDINRINRLIHSASISNTVMPRVLTPRFWISTMHAFVIGSRHGK